MFIMTEMMVFYVLQPAAHKTTNHNHKVATAPSTEDNNKQTD